MSKPEFDRPDKDSESMFDFLREGGAEKSARPKGPKRPPQEGGNRPLPVIRKPVPISESGPLLPPKPGAPVEPPPRLTDNPSAKPEDEFGFLDDISLDDTLGRPGKVTPAGTNNVTELPSKSDATTAPLDLDDLHLDDTADFSNSRTGDRNVTTYDSSPSERRPLRWLAIGVAVLLIGAGVSSFIVTDPLGLTSDSDSQASIAATDSSSSNGLGDTDTEALDALPSGGLQISPMFQAYKEQLAAITSLIDKGELDEAEQVLATMDPFVYGYGSEEFQAQETRISRIRSGEITVDTPTEAEIAEQQARAEAQRLEAERAQAQAAEQRLQEQRAAEQAAEAQRLEEQRQEAATAEAERLEKLREAEQTALAEAERLNQQRLAEQAARAEAQAKEQQRLAALAEREAALELEKQRLAERTARAEAARLEQERLAEVARQRQEELKQQAIAAEAERLEQQRQAERAALVESRRREQARLAQIEAEQEAQARLAAEQKQREEEANRRATDRQIAEQRAAAQRQQAREQRLIEAREREQARQAAASAAEEQSSTPANSVASGNQLASSDQPISEEELELVYRRFANLQQAIRDRDINAVVSLTRRSGARVQQFMQVFENSVQIDARIRNVSTRNATGEIIATLQINGVRRPDGSVVKPPSDLKSISISSKRDVNGWSAIRW